jgi:predicted 2-oxoglutarate/Fe(II)-dependent dioxygenase YbiX
LVADLIGLHAVGGSFESGVTSIDPQGRSYMKLDPTRKSRRDHWIADGTPLHARVHDVFARRLFPEIQKVFQAEMTHADRLLVARYPEQEGIFKRHRDNSSPTVRFRKFAMSLNLNVGDYEGGDLIFPEYSPHLYSPPTGGAAVFSASLLHEVTRITRGNRYVLLTFFHDAAGEAMRIAS